jgi:hypothetical protein
MYMIRPSTPTTVCFEQYIYSQTKHHIDNAHAYKIAKD